jgi:hypothetical protein
VRDTETVCNACGIKWKTNELRKKERDEQGQGQRKNEGSAVAG